MKVLSLLPILMVAHPANAVDECPASLALHIPDIERADIAVANSYALCVRGPWLPTAEELQAKLSACRTKLPASQSRELQQAIDWVDHIATNFPGCETNLEITDKND